MSTEAGPLVVRMFMEGIEVPFIAGQVSIAPGTPATGAFQIIPTDAALLFLPRTMVHVFFLDALLSDTDSALADQLAKEQEINRFEDGDGFKYRLLYAGEVIGIQYQKSSNSRSLVLQCLDFSSYWDTCYQWFADFSVGGNGLTDRTHNFVGAGEYLFNNVASGTRWVIGNILRSAPENPRYANEKGLLAGFIHLLETIGGIHPRSGTFGGFRGVNDFFSIAELRYKLTGMIGAVSGDTTSAQIYDAKAFIDWLRYGMASAGSLVSFRDVLRLVGQYIFHEVYPNPAARYVRGGSSTVRIPRTISESTLGRDIVTQLESIRSSLQSASGALKQVASTGNAIAWENARDPIGTALQTLQSISESAQALKSGERSALEVAIRLTTTHLSEALDRLNAYSSPSSPNREDTLGGPQGSDVANRIDSAIAPIDAALSTARRRRTEFVDRTINVSDHLFNQLILPETFFVAPPRCNVFFPDMYNQFSFSRNFLREVTRLSVQGGLGIIAGSHAGADVLARYYFAPNIRDVRGKMARATIFRQGTTILPHEIWSGIIPKFEWISDGHRWASKQGQVSENAQERKIRYIQRLANFQFLIHRWSARTMTLSGRFNPYPVCGLPGIVIDRTSPAPAALEAIADVLGAGWSILPTAYIGKIEQLAHQVGQYGGTTNIVFSRARTHRSYDDEYLGIVDRERRDLADRMVAVSVSSLISAVQTGSSVDEESRQILVLFVNGTIRPNVKLSSETIVKGTPRSSSNTVLLTLGAAQQLGVSKEAFDAYHERTSATGSELDTEILVPATITVDVVDRTQFGRFVTPAGGIRPEVILRPSWYSPVWSNEQISDNVYQVLLGCDAIVDDVGAASSDAFAALMKLYLTESGEAVTDVSVEVTDPSAGEQAGSVIVNGKVVSSFNVGGTASIEQAIDALTITYGTLAKKQLSTERFVNGYIYRPIATMTDILGSPNLEFDDAGAVKQPTPGEFGPVPLPTEGFHSRAFGDFNTDVKFANVQGLGEDEGDEPQPGERALHLLLTAEERSSLQYPIYNKGKKLENLIPLYMDPRGRAQQRVQAYMAELRLNRGLVGG